MLAPPPDFNRNHVQTDIKGWPQIWFDVQGGTVHVRVAPCTQRGHDYKPEFITWSWLRPPCGGRPVGRVSATAPVISHQTSRRRSTQVNAAGSLRITKAGGAGWISSEWLKYYKRPSTEVFPLYLIFFSLSLSPSLSQPLYYSLRSN